MLASPYSGCKTVVVVVMMMVVVITTFKPRNKRFWLAESEVSPGKCTILLILSVVVSYTRFGVIFQNRTLSPVYTIQPVVKPVDNRMNVCIHDATGCETSCQTGCPVVSCIQTFNRLQPVWQPAVSCIQPVRDTRNRFLHIKAGCSFCRPTNSVEALERREVFRCSDTCIESVKGY